MADSWSCTKKERLYVFTYTKVAAGALHALKGVEVREQPVKSEGEQACWNAVSGLEKDWSYEQSQSRLQG